MIIKFGSQGSQVKLYKDMLVALGYLHASTHDFFGRDSQKATRKFQAANGLKIDGIIGKNTAAAILEKYALINNPSSGTSEIADKLSELLSGEAMISYGARLPIVKGCKDILYALGYLHASTHDFFGQDTLKAVKIFQAVHSLVVDGIVGRNTAKALIYDYYRHKVPDDGQVITEYLTAEEYPHIHPEVLASINMNLQDETPVRIALVKEDLKWIMPHGMYVYSYNLYTTKLKPQPITEKGIRKVASYYPGYYTRGRLDYQLGHLDHCEREGIYLSGCDCSGKEVGLYRKLGIFPSNWDCKAHWLYHSYCIPISEAQMRPGDLVFKRVSSGRITHTAMYVGAGYISEAAGTAYGIQITDNFAHVVLNYNKNKLEKHTKFNLFGRPTFIA